MAQTNSVRLKLNVGKTYLFRGTTYEEGIVYAVPKDLARDLLRKMNPQNVGYFKIDVSELDRDEQIDEQLEQIAGPDVVEAEIEVETETQVVEVAPPKPAVPQPVKPKPAGVKV